MKKKIVLALLVSFLLPPMVALSAELIVYPAKGQSSKQLEKDKYECYSWAKGQTGFDPMQAQTASTPPPQQTQPQSSPLKGAARGALLGTAVGAVAGDAGKGAAIGATAGGLTGAMKKRDQQAQQQNAQSQWAQQEASQTAQKQGSYDRAYSACLEGRGYTVK